MGADALDIRPTRVEWWPDPRGNPARANERIDINVNARPRLGRSQKIRGGKEDIRHEQQGNRPVRGWYLYSLALTACSHGFREKLREWTGQSSTGQA